MQKKAWNKSWTQRRRTVSVNAGINMSSYGNGIEWSESELKRNRIQTIIRLEGKCNQNSLCKIRVSVGLLVVLQLHRLLILLQLLCSLLHFSAACSSYAPTHQRRSYFSNDRDSRIAHSRILVYLRVVRKKWRNAWSHVQVNAIQVVVWGASIGVWTSAGLFWASSSKRLQTRGMKRLVSIT